MKKTSTIKLVIALALSLTANASFAQQNVGQEGWNQTTRDQFEIPRGNYTGRSPYMTPADMSAPTPDAPRAPKTACSDPTWGLIRMSKTMPSDITLGSEFVADLKITAVGCAADVVIKDVVPAGTTYVKSDPAATVDGNKLLWNVGDLDAGQTINAKITLRADKEGQIVNCASVAANPRTCATAFVGKPALALEKSGPETANLGDNVTYTIIVKNTGTAIARNVVVTDPVPDGYSHAGGQAEISSTVGDLAPGQSKTLSATFKANKRGKVCNVATANSSNAGKVSDDACTVIRQPGLKIEKTGTPNQIIGRKADYQITVSNTGDTDLAGVSVVDSAPEGTTLVAAPGGSISGNKATWTASIPAGGKQSFSATVVGKVAGNLCNTASASVAGLTDSAQACTVWKGIAAILLEVVDGPDPIQVGESTTYTIKVTNQGFADIHNVKVVATYDDKTEPTAAARGSISGKTVNFAPVTVIEAKKTITYTITVKGVQAGDSRNKVLLTSDELTTPVDETESTTVY